MISATGRQILRMSVLLLAMLSLAAAQWIAPLPERKQYRRWCELVSSRQNGHRETAWRLSGL